MAESWDLDDDFVLPTGPLSLSASHSDADTSTSSLPPSFTSSQGSVPFGAEDEEMDWDAEMEMDGEGDADGEGGLTQRVGGPIAFGLGGLKGGSQMSGQIRRGRREEDGGEGDMSIDLDDLDSSFSSTSSSEKQSTLKALPSTTSTSSHHANINAAVLAVLASGAKGTVTKLQPSRRVLSPKRAGMDWDEDIEMPMEGLRQGSVKRAQRGYEEMKMEDEGEEKGGTLRLKPKRSYASSLGDLFDEDEDVTAGAASSLTIVCLAADINLLDRSHSSAALQAAAR